MTVWAAFVALVLSGTAYISADPSAFIINLAELGGVIILFMLVCAAESFDHGKT